MRLSRIKKRIDLPWLITLALFISIYIGRLSAYGSYIIAFLTMIFFIVSLLFSKKKPNFKIGFYHWHLLLFALFSLLSSAWSIDSNGSIGKSITLFEILICFSVFSMYYLNESNGVNKLLKVIMWGGFIVSIYSFFEYGIKGIFNTLLSAGRIESTFNNVNEIAGLCSLTLVLVLFFWIEEGFSIKYLLSAPTFVLLLACSSKRAIICLFVCMILLFVLTGFRGEKRIVKKRTVAISITLLAMMLFVLGSSITFGLSERMSYFIAGLTGTKGADHSTLLRKELIEFGFDIFRTNPLIGVGIGAPHVLVLQRYSSDFYLHNNYVELLAGGGIIGFILYYSIYIFIAFPLIKIDRLKCKYSRIVLVILVFLLITDIASGAYYSKETYFFLMVCFVHTFALKKSIQHNDLKKETI